jgi:ABC-type multidrug transport system ATPase subunit
MGASGAGKSTLLDILATRIPRSAVDGDYLLNDKPVDGSFKRLSGYVMQDDALYPLLTVRETLQVRRAPPRHTALVVNSALVDCIVSIFNSLCILQ